MTRDNVNRFFKIENFHERCDMMTKLETINIT